MTYIKWDDKQHSVGVKLIDKQHKHFIGLLNELYACLESKNVSDLPKIINDVSSYAELHFKTEEDYFDKFKYEEADHHKSIHDTIRGTVQGFMSREDDPTTVGFDLLYFLERWFLIHIKGTDKKYVKCFHDNGLK